jgi:hypothetical protein
VETTRVSEAKRGGEEVECAGARDEKLEVRRLPPLVHTALIGRYSERRDKRAECWAFRRCFLVEKQKRHC